MPGKLSRLAMLLAAIGLCLGLFLPLWTFELYAPQYPEGLRLYIWANHLSGDLSSINVLNHYVGMQPIDPTAFVEFKIVPWILGVMSFAALVVTAIHRRIAVVAWLSAFGILGLWAFYDFYAWGSRFGSEINPNAPLKFEGMHYQPPLIGFKDMLNITAWSLPEMGGVAIGLSFLLGVTSYVLLWRSKSP